MVEKLQMMTTPNPGAARQGAKRRITPRQKVWLIAYISGESFGNATAAARAARYKWPNHSGPENLQKLRDLIDQAMHVRLYKQPEKAAAWVEAKLVELRETELGKGNA